MAKLSGSVVVVVVLLFQVFASSQASLIAAYWGAWSIYRPSIGQFTASDIPADDLDILYYAFAGLDDSTYVIKSLDPWADLSPEEGGHYDGYRQAVALRQTNPQLKVILSIGGWAEGSDKYSIMAARNTLRYDFVSSIVPFLETYDFDGLDLDWEYPGERGGSVQDRDHFTTLVQELSAVLKDSDKLLTVSIGGFRDQIDVSYDFPSFADYVDYFNGMTYTYYTYYDHHTVLPSSALYPKFLIVDPVHTVNFTANYYLAKGVPASKLLLGVISSGTSYTLSNEYQHELGDPASGLGNPGPVTGTPGLLATYEICQYLQSGIYAVVEESVTDVPYCYGGDQWVSYEDTTSVYLKASFASSNNLAGVALWTIDLDDTQQVCSTSPGAYLLNELAYVLHNKPRPQGAGQILGTNTRDKI